MKKIYFLSFLFLGCILQSQAQTKLIAHKSHSGNLSHFKTALEGNLFDMKISNFGGGPLMQTVNRLDSLVKVDDTTVVMHMTTFFGSTRSDTLVECSAYDREMIFTEYSDVEFEEDALNLLKTNTGFDFPMTETKIVGYKTKGFKDIKVVPSSMPSHIPNDKAIKVDSQLLIIKEKTKKELRKEKRASKKVGDTKGKSEVKVCTKPEIGIPFFKKETIVEKEETVVIENKGQHWMIVIGLGLFSVLLGMRHK